MSNNNGLLNLLGFIALIAGVYVWVNTVETVTIIEQQPPPQDSWEVVYPQFRDDVSAQLLNTQLMAGSIINDTAYIKNQNNTLQYSVDLLLNNLGVLKEESYEESIRQRDEERVLTVLSVFVGWLAGVVATREDLKKGVRRLFTGRIANISEASTRIINSIFFGRRLTVQIWFFAVTIAITLICLGIFIQNG